MGAPGADRSSRECRHPFRKRTRYRPAVLEPVARIGACIALVSPSRVDYVFSRTTGTCHPAPDGEVAEWLNAPHSKCGIRATVSGVRIPPSPPHSLIFLIRLENRQRRYAVPLATRSMVLGRRSSGQRSER